MYTGLSLPYTISLVMLFVGTAVEAPGEPLITLCSHHCYCSSSSGGEVTAQCFVFSDTDMLSDIANLPGNLSSL